MAERKVLIDLPSGKAEGVELQVEEVGFLPSLALCERENWGLPVAKLAVPVSAFVIKFSNKEGIRRRNEILRHSIPICPR
ncbi:MAG: hypothetical protein HYU44_19155, partial [Betaproteobacteria bacterium]|nr:hypothetical protein [Betaproteobacteria bacterium]